MAQNVHAAQGTYLLVAQLDYEVKIQVGKLGRFDFAAGHYAYAGSALGPGGLHARLARHARIGKRLHWHIDYLLQHAVLDRVWQLAYPGRLECAWATAVQSLAGACTPVPGFGTSDCRCITHLVFFPQRPADRQITAALSSPSPAQLEICCTHWPTA